MRPAYEMLISDWSSDVCSSDLRRADTVLGLCASGEVGDRIQTGYARHAGHDRRRPRQSPGADLAAVDRHDQRSDHRAPPPEGLGKLAALGGLLQRWAIAVARGRFGPAQQIGRAENARRRGASLVSWEERRGGQEGVYTCRSR